MYAADAVCRPDGSFFVAAVPAGRMTCSVHHEGAGNFGDRTFDVAADTMQELGYTNVASMKGGFNRWKDEGRAWKRPQRLTAEQRNRYQRHLLVDEVGEPHLSLEHGADTFGDRKLDPEAVGKVA